MAKAAQVREGAQKFYSAGKWDKALQAYSMLAKMEPKDPKNHQKVAELQVKIGLQKEAVESYKQALEVYMEKGFLIQAIAMCKIVIQMDPSQKEMESRLAQLYSQRGIGAAPAGPRGATFGVRTASPPPKATPAPVAPRPPAAQIPVEAIGQSPLPAPPAPKSAAKKPEAAVYEIPLEPGEDTTPDPFKPNKPAKTKTFDLSDSIEEESAPELAPEEEAGEIPDEMPDTIEMEPSGSAEAELSDLPPMDMPPLESAASAGTDELPPMEETGKPAKIEIPILDEDLPPIEELEPSPIKATAPPPPPASESAEPELKEEGMDIDVMGEEPEAEVEEKPEAEIKVEAEAEIPVEPEEEISVLEEEEAEPEPAPKKEAPEQKVYDLSEEMEKPSEALISADALDEEWLDTEEPEEEPALPSGQELICDDDLGEICLFPDVPLFKDLGKDEFRSVLGKLKSRSVKKGEVLINDGEEGDSIFIIASGEVAIYKEAEKGKKIPLGTLRDGDFFGEFGYFAGSKRQASVAANEDTEVLEMERDDMDQVVTEFPQVEEVLNLFYKERVMQNILATSTLFRELTIEERKKVAQRFQLTEVREGEDVVKEGQEGDSMYLIRSGHVLVHTQNPMGEKIDLAELQAGDFFGEVSLIQGKPRTATVTANSPVLELMKLSKKDLDEIIEEHPAVLDKLNEVIMARLKQTVNKVSILDLGEEDLNLGSLL